MFRYKEKRLPSVPRRRWMATQLSMAHAPLETLMAYRMRYGDFFKMDFGMQQTHIACSPEAARHVLQLNHRNYIKSRATRMIGELIGQGLLTSEGAYWLRQRRLIQPAFHRKRVEGLAELMIGQTEAFIGRMKARAGESVDMSHEMMELNLSLVMRALFSTGIDQIDLRGFERAFAMQQELLIMKIRQPLRLMAARLRGRLGRYREEAQRVHRIIDDLLDYRMAHSAENYNDLLGMLMDSRDEESGATLTRRQLHDETLILFLAGHETSACALAWLIYLVATHPAVEAQMLAEIQRAMPAGKLDFEGIKQLEYTRQVVQECLRLYPPAYITGRESVESDTVCGYELAPGSTVTVFIYGIHRHPALWPEPDTFDPDRFTPEKAAQIPAFAYLPFGAGPRICIGNQFAMQEMLIITALLFYHFKVQYTGPVPPLVEPLVTLRPAGGIPVVLQPRQ